MAQRLALRRALLYVPASSERMLAKSRNLQVDCVVYDLEDSVAPDQKANARRAVNAFLEKEAPPGVKEVAVRVNSVESGLALADLTEVLKSPYINTLLIPKVHSASDLHFIADAIQQIRPSSSSTLPPRLLPLIESAKAITNLSAICTATPLVDGLIFAAEDFCHDVSITRTPSLTELLFARSAVVTAARAHGLPSSIDIVCTHFRHEDISILRSESENGRGMGFTGKQVIHPAQVEIVQEAYSPSWRDVEWAVRIVRADQRALEMGKGAFSLDRKMIDVPVVRRAKSIVSRAVECGMDLGPLTQKWEGQQPE